MCPFCPKIALDSLGRHAVTCRHGGDPHLSIHCWMEQRQASCTGCYSTSAGHQYISWAPVHQLGTSTSAGHQYISWAPVHHLGTSTSAGYQYISWAPVHQLGTSTSAGHQYISWAPVHQHEPFSNCGDSRPLSRGQQSNRHHL